MCIIFKLHSKAPTSTSFFDSIFTDTDLGDSFPTVLFSNKQGGGQTAQGSGGRILSLKGLSAMQWGLPLFLKSDGWQESTHVDAHSCGVVYNKNSVPDVCSAITLASLTSHLPLLRLFF